MDTINGEKKMSEDEVNEIVNDQCEVSESKEREDTPEVAKLKKRYRHIGVVYQLLSQGLFLGNHCDAIKEGMECMDELYKETHENIKLLTENNN